MVGWIAFGVLLAIVAVPIAIVAVYQWINRNKFRAM